MIVGGMPLGTLAKCEWIAFRVI